MNTSNFFCRIKSNSQARSLFWKREKKCAAIDNKKISPEYSKN